MSIRWSVALALGLMSGTAVCQVQKTHAFNDDPMAVALDHAIANNLTNSSARRELARHYGDDHPALRDFYAATADALQGNDVRWPGEHAPVMQCRVAISPESRQAYLDLQGKYAFAEEKDAPQYLEAATAALRQHGDSCDLLLSWANAVLFASEWKCCAITPAMQERAVRILFELGEHHRPLHEHEPSPQLYLDIANFFATARKDFTSAYVAATIAETRIDTASSMTKETRERYRTKLERARRAYGSRVPLPPPAPR